MFVDVIVVGSGFGGAVMAARLTRQLGDNQSLLVLDKGRDHTDQFDPQPDDEPLNAQGNRFRHSLAPSYLNNVAEVFSDHESAIRDGAPTFNVIAGVGIGGGSNVYDGVSLRTPSSSFDLTRHGRRLWPAGYSRAALDAHYQVVEQQLHVHRLEWTDATVPHWQLATQRDYVFAEGCRRIGAAAAPLKLATDNDANECWWTQGQRFEGRQNLTKNYLAQAKAAGAMFRAYHDVRSIEPLPNGYVVRGLRRSPGATTDADEEFEYECRVLIVAAGAVASTGLLLRSRDNFAVARDLDPGGLLGKEVSGNGDYGVSGTVGSDFGFAVEGHKGKPMSSFCPTYFAEHQFILIPFYAPLLYMTLGQPTKLLRPADPLALGRRSTSVAADATGQRERDWGLAYKQRLATFSSNMLTMGCLAVDDGEGEIFLDGDRVGVRWSDTRPTTEARWSSAVDVMRQIYQALGGEMYLDSYRDEGTVNTAHPLGGCRMADDELNGVVNGYGESFRNRNLFVVDASVIPSALGVNPSITIAAIAERISGSLIAGDGTESLASRLA